MLLTIPDILLIPYGAGQWLPGDVSITAVQPRLVLASAAPCAVIDRRAATPLRLNTSRYEPSLAPDLTLGGEDQVVFLREYLKRLCGHWDGVSHRFLDWYFARIAQHVDVNRAELTERLAGTEGLFKVSDWIFSAPKPLPRAQLYAPSGDGASGEAAGTDYIEVPFAFWLGDQVVAVRAREHALTPRKAASEEARLAAAGVRLVTFGAAELGDGASGLFARLFEPPHDQFWLGQSLPMGPFRPAALED